MTYDDYRPLIKTGDLLFFSNAVDSFSWYDFQIRLVRMFTMSEFSHVGMAYVVSERIFIMEAVSSGVRLFPLSRSLPFFHIANPVTLSKNALEWAFSNIGVSYESKWRMVLDKFFDMRLRGNKRLQCSEYINGILAVNEQSLTHIDTPSAVLASAMRYWGSLQYVQK